MHDESDHTFVFSTKGQGLCSECASVFQLRWGLRVQSFRTVSGVWLARNLAGFGYKGVADDQGCVNRCWVVSRTCRVVSACLDHLKRDVGFSRVLRT